MHIDFRKNFSKTSAAELFSYSVIFSSSFLAKFLQSKVATNFAFTANYFFQNRKAFFSESDINASGLRFLAISFALFYFQQLAHEYLKEVTALQVYNNEREVFHEKLDELEKKKSLILYEEFTGKKFPTQNFLGDMKNRSEFKSELACFLGSISYYKIFGFPLAVSTLVNNFSKNSLTREDFLCTTIMVVPTMIPIILSIIAIIGNSFMKIKNVVYKESRKTADTSDDIIFRTNNPLVVSDARLGAYLSKYNKCLRTKENSNGIFEFIEKKSISIDAKLDGKYRRIPLIGIAFRLFAQSNLTVGDFFATLLFQSLSVEFTFKLSQILNQYLIKKNALTYIKFLNTYAYKPTFKSNLGNQSIHVESLEININAKLNLKAERISFLTGKVYSLVGKSGVGKTTFVKAIDGKCAFVQKDSGNEIEINENAKGKIYYISQDGFSGLPGIMTTRDFLTTGHNELQFDNDKVIIEILKKFDLHKFAENLYDMLHKPSGGEQARLLIAKAIIGGAKIIIIDEGMDKTSGMNTESTRSDRSKYQIILKKYAQKFGITILSIEHNSSKWADYTLEFNKNDNDVNLSLRSLQIQQGFSLS